MEVEFLDDLFILVKYGGHFDAYPTVALAEHRLNVLRKHTADTFSVTQIVDALLFLGFLKTLHPEMAKSIYFDGLKKDAAQNLISNIGFHSYLSFIASDKRESESHSEDAVSLCEKSLRAIVNFSSFTPEDASIWEKHLPIAAIDIGATLCAKFHKLPTKKALRAAMEEKGLVYSKKNKDIPCKWREMFQAAGLGSLPD